MAYFDWQRDRMAFTAILKLLAFTASRPGEIVVSRTVADNPDALRWSDIELIRTVFTNADGTLGSSLYAKVRIRLLKGKRYNDGEYKCATLIQDVETPLLCPVLDLLGLAQIQSVLDVAMEQILDFSLEGKTPGNYKVPFKAEQLDKFVFRKIHNSSGQVFATEEAATYDCFEYRLSSLALAANIDVRTTSYVFRRLAFNAVNRPEVTLEDRRLLLGHEVTRSVFTAYINRTTQVDLQGLITKGAENRQAIKETGRLSRGYELPKKVTAQNRAAVFSRAEIQALIAQVKEARRVFAETHSGITLTQARLLQLPEAMTYFELSNQRMGRARVLLKAMHMEELVKYVQAKDREAFTSSTAGAEEQDADVSAAFDSTVDAHLLNQDAGSNNMAMDGFEALELAQDLDLSDIEAAPSQIEERFGLRGIADDGDAEWEEADEIEQGEMVAEGGADFDLTLVDPRLREEQGELDNDATLVEDEELVAVPTTRYEMQCTFRRNMINTLLGKAGDGALFISALLQLLIDNALLSSHPVVQALSHEHPDRGCAICGATELSYDDMVPHRIRCAEGQAIAGFIETSHMVELLQTGFAQCPLKANNRQRSCNGFSSSDPFKLAAHMYTTHVKKHKDRGKGICPASGCQEPLETPQDVRVHLEDEHEILVSCTTLAIDSRWRASSG